MLDTQTLMIVLAMIAVFVAIVVLIAWRGERRYAGMREIRIGLPLLAGAMLLSGLRQVLPAVPAIGLGNLGIVVGSVLSLNGVLMLAGRRPLWFWHIALATAFLLPFFYFLLIEPSTPVRAELAGLFDAFLHWSAFVVLIRRSGGGLKTRRSLAALLLLHGSVEAGRGLATLFWDPAVDYRGPSQLVTFSALEQIFFAVALTMFMIQLVSERLQADLLRSEARIASAFHVASDAFALFDGERRLIAVNQCFCAFFPDAADHARAGAAMTSLFGLAPDRFGLDASWLGEVAADGDLPALDRVVRLPDDVWLHVSSERTGDGGLVLCWSDITVFKQAEGILANELARERELATIQRSFVSMASHQFRTPLSIIDINAQLLELAGRPPMGRDEVSQRVTRIRRTVRRMIGLMEVMLGAASAEAGKIQVNRVPCDLAGLLRDACERMREIAPDRLFELDVEQLPATVLCDANLIDQVIVNLLSNAVKYSRKPYQVMVLGRTEGNAAVFAVEDFGVGIAPEDQAHIFERFFRANNVGSIAGTGIGLTLARYIVDLHGGGISVASQLGAGSTFTVRLPIV
ncbi:sensor histidine kinase [Telmatospirillum siberiense]|uniref:histidine kinase n=1 Tax=Telmatospirillum siberiense TaxID=382514 RepID=A0A2N3PTS5_9PROT|nr:PAS domain-containing sensor histidine kinase [Telmatospirillum siberiense]PKU23786.1 hypothetical protein CWS72_14960 [Telmatospirillum siberiense]